MHNTEQYVCLAVSTFFFFLIKWLNCQPVTFAALICYIIGTLPCSHSTGLFLFIMLLSLGISFHFENAAAPDCLFVSLKRMPLL